MQYMQYAVHLQVCQGQLSRSVGTHKLDRGSTHPDNLLHGQLHALVVPCNTERPARSVDERLRAHSQPLLQRGMESSQCCSGRRSTPRKHLITQLCVHAWIATDLVTDHCNVIIIIHVLCKACSA